MTTTALSAGPVLWDTPETGADPQTQRAVAHAIVELAHADVQVIIATRSLFLLRELQIALREPRYADVAHGAGYIGLHHHPSGTRAHHGPTLTDTGPLTALHEENAQSARCHAALQR